MELILGESMSGKTTKLIDLVVEANLNGDESFLVVRDRQAAFLATQISKVKHSFGSFPFPLTYNEFLSRKYNDLRVNSFFVDDLDNLIEYMIPAKIAAASLRVSKKSMDSLKK